MAPPLERTLTNERRRGAGLSSSSQLPLHTVGKWRVNDKLPAAGESEALKRRFLSPILQKGNNSQQFIECWAIFTIYLLFSIRLFSK